jgi:hypothetical protein
VKPDTRRQIVAGLVLTLTFALAIISCSMVNSADWPRQIVRWPTTIKSAAPPAAKSGMKPALPAPQKELPAPAKSSSRGASDATSSEAPAREQRPAPAASCPGGQCGQRKTTFRFFNLWRK